MWQKLRISRFQNKLIPTYIWIQIYYSFFLCHKNIWHEYFSLVVRLHCLKANCLSELVELEISQDKDSSSLAVERIRFLGWYKDCWRRWKAPHPESLTTQRMQGLGTTCHSIGMTVEHIIYVHPADFSTNFCIHSCRLPGSFSKPSCIPWQRIAYIFYSVAVSIEWDEVPGKLKKSKIVI